MKKQLAKLVFLISLATSNLTHAAPTFDHILKTETGFNLSASANLDEKLEDTLLNPEGFLNRIVPAGVSVSKKVILGNSFEYIVVKRILGFPKQFHLLGTITFERTISGCPVDQLAYLAQLDFTASGPAVTDTISDFTLLFCAKKTLSDSLEIKSINTLFYKGDKFNSLIEKIAKSLINDQVDAIAVAIKDELTTK